MKNKKEIVEIAQENRKVELRKLMQKIETILEVCMRRNGNGKGMLCLYREYFPFGYTEEVEQNLKKANFKVTKKHNNMYVHY